MKIIIKNPFRVLGLLGNASQRKIQKQIAIIKRFAQIEQIKAFHYDFEIKVFHENFNAIRQANQQIKQMLEQSNNIATMAYGDCNHPQVMQLRKFRDEKLAKNVFGKIFIKFYYILSPYLVLMLKNNQLINNLS